MLAYARSGSGPPLVLLHGTNSSRAVWDPLLAALTASNDVVAIDLRGHGASPATSAVPREWAVDVSHLLDGLEGTQSYLRGMCMQCMVGAMTAGPAATGTRAWVIARVGARLTPRRKSRLTKALLAASVLAAGLIGPSAT